MRSISVSPHTTNRVVMGANLTEPLWTRTVAVAAGDSLGTAASPSAQRGPHLLGDGVVVAGRDGLVTDLSTQLQQRVVGGHPFEPLDAAVQQRAVAAEPAGHREHAERRRLARPDGHRDDPA